MTTGMRQVDPRFETFIGGDDFAPTDIANHGEPNASTPADTQTAVAEVAANDASDTTWVTIDDRGTQVQCWSFLPYSAMRALVKAQKVGQDDPAALFDAVDSILERVLVDQAGFQAYVDMPSNRVDSKRFFEIFTAITQALTGGDQGKP